MRYMEEVFVMINVMSDEMPIYDFNMLKHQMLATIDKHAKKKRASKKKHASTRIDMEF